MEHLDIDISMMNLVSTYDAMTLQNVHSSPPRNVYSLPAVAPGAPIHPSVRRVRNLNARTYGMACCKLFDDDVPMDEADEIM